MTGEGRFFDTLGLDQVTEIPGGLVADGPIKKADDNYVHEFFNVNPVCVAKVGAGAAVGTTGAENLCMLNDSIFEYHMLGSGQTIVAPVLAAAGLDISLDAGDNEGTEMCLGISAGNKGVFTVGGPAFYTKMTFTIADVSITDDCVFGFRKVEAYQAAVDDYDEMAALNVVSGNILYQNIINNGTTTVTDTTNNWADTGKHEIAVYVSAAGVTTFTIDGAAPLVLSAFSFDATEVVVPFFYYIHASAAAIGLVLNEFECGLQ